MEKENNDLYGKKLKRLRINQFITQSDMAIKFKISQQAYAKMEYGKTNFTLKKVEKICKFFNITVKEFLTINYTQSKIKNRNNDSYNVRVLKQHYERLLLLKDIEIADLQMKVQHLNKDKKTSRTPSKLRVII